MSQPELGPDFEREWPELMDELRVVLPGIQLLFGFLLMAPFSGHFDSVIGHTRDAYLLCFLTATAASIFFIAPSVYHRLHWRHDVRDKEQMMRTCNALAIVGGVMLAIAMTSAVYVVMAVVSASLFANLFTVAAGALIALLWFVLPLVRRTSERRRARTRDG